MPITLRLAPDASGRGRENAPSLTFDGTSRVVLGRGAGSDVRLPDPSVSHRHAVIQVERSDFTLVDEGSSNGTFVGEVRLPRGAPRVLRSGDRIRLGRVFLDVTLDLAPPTRDVAGATRELALALVAGAMAERGDDRTPRLVVVEGRDRGAELLLHEPERVYVIGRGPESALALSDGDASREHVAVYRRDSLAGSGGMLVGTVYLRDLGSKNGAYLGDEPLARERDVLWKPQLALALGHTVIALDEPLAATLARLEAAADEAMAEDEVPPEPPPANAGPDSLEAPPSTAAPDTGHVGDAPIVAMPPSIMAAPPPPLPKKKKSGWSPVDVAVVIAAVVVLVMSIAGMTWLLK
jgi:pSer/pThr/pTyr-binding forkhead associated (FHA) protein